jgi:hypothetical protein
MATIGRSLRSIARRRPGQIAKQSYTPFPVITRRQSTVSPIVRHEEEKRKIAAKLASDKFSEDEIVSLLGTDDLESLESSSDMASQSDKSTPPEIDRRTLLEIFNQFDDQNGELLNMMQKYPPFKEPMLRKPKPGFLNMGVDPGDDPEEDPEFEGDDITSMAHGQLDQHREFREYARLAAWEMPLLTSMDIDCQT